MNSALSCHDERRRRHLRERRRNGIEYIEVSSDQLTINVHFFGRAPEQIERENIRIAGGRRIRGITVTDVRLCVVDDQEVEDCIEVVVDRAGDFSPYTLQLVKTAAYDPAIDFDQRYSQATFSFKADCPSDLDCQTPASCPHAQLDEPDLNYLAKDYASFRQLILDRLALVMPEWQERHAADLGITLVEVLAYAGDYLSYYQDAVATEAYLQTARQRISVRRHARLVDYHMHEGCNARTWVCLETEADTPLDLQGVSFITDGNDALGLNSWVVRPEDLRTIPSTLYEVFEPLNKAVMQLRAAHNRITVYTWGDRDCCLPIGATSATLRDGDAVPPPAPPSGDYGSATPSGAYGSPPSVTPPARRLDLAVGDILIFEEVVGPRTGNPADADPTHRQAVRLTNVVPVIDELYGQAVLEISWAAEDALPFPLCLSTTTQGPACLPLEDVSVARGNVILVDHGRTITPEPLGTVLGIDAVPPCDDCGEALRSLPSPFRPSLQHAPLTFSQPLSRHAPAAAQLRQQVRSALPQMLDLMSTSAERPWHWRPQFDLLGSQADALDYVVEIDDAGYGHVRFGDGELGRMPPVGMEFTATYRTGNGPAGNVGAGTIKHMLVAGILEGITSITNPLPAQGGTAPEPLTDVKLFAPGAFRKQLWRAITPADYAQLAASHPGVQKAVASLRWSGSWYEMVVAIDPLGTDEAGPELLQSVKRFLYPFRRVGYDLRIVQARYIPLDITLTVCIDPHYLRGHMAAALADRFSNRRLPNGDRGYFHPDNLSFGDSIALSKLVAAAQAVQGVANIEQLQISARAVDYIWPQANTADGLVLPNPIVPLGPLEIAQVDTDPDFPENGTVKFVIRGGR